MSRVEITQKALKHGQTVLAGGLWYRVEMGIGMDTDWHIFSVETGARVVTARNQSDLRRWLHDRGRRDVA